MRLQIETTKKFKRNWEENAVEDVKPYLVPQNIFDCVFFEHQFCVMWPLINEIRKKIRKKKRKILKLRNSLYYSKPIIFKVIKAIIYKKKELKKFT